MSIQRKPRRVERLTLKELRTITEDYHRSFPDWHLLEGTLIARENGPVLQYIGFEQLLGGAYRIQCGVYYMCVPDRDGGLNPPQYPNIRQSINLRAHASLWDKAVQAIHKEIIPSVDCLLHPEQVLALHEKCDNIRSPDAHSLAALNAFIGHEKRAIYWCSRFTELVNKHGLGWQDFDYKRRAFLDQLEQWLKVGEAKKQLEHVLQEERLKWGLA
jgi:hypothetical protein